MLLLLVPFGFGFSAAATNVYVCVHQDLLRVCCWCRLVLRATSS